MAKRKFAVVAEDQNGDLCMVESDRHDSAEAIAKKSGKMATNTCRYWKIQTDPLPVRRCGLTG
jgi:hypothetical protein